MLIKVYASGTNVQRLAKGSGHADGVIYTAYSQLEQTEEKIVRRKFYMLEVNTLKQDVEQLDEKVQPSWVKIWGKPNANKVFINKLFRSFVGDEELRNELNLSNITGEQVECFMLLVSADNKEMKQIKQIADRAIPNYHIKVLNGDFTNNKSAQYETIKEINEARIAGKTGVVIIANQMGSRSYSVPEIQSTVIAYDRGSVDTTMQKVSRCLTPGNNYVEEEKEFGHIVDLSFDPNRSDNIERLLVDEIIQVSKSEGIAFPAATSYVLSSIDCFKVRYGTAIEVNEEEMFKILGDNDSLLRVADVTVDINAALDIIDELENINTASKQRKLRKTAIDSAKNKITEGGDPGKPVQDLTDKAIEKIINNAIHALNMSATSVYNLAFGGETYSECINIIASSLEKSQEFFELFGVTPCTVKLILERNILNEPILDVIVQNSKIVNTPFFLM